MARRSTRTGAAVIALVLLLSALAVPEVAAKGRPTRVAFTQVACGSVAFEATWWKQLTPQSVWALLFIGSGSNPQQVVTVADPTGIASPFAYSFQLVGFSIPTTTYRVVVSLYADMAGQTLLGMAESSVTLSCSI